jgi:hypothetical protein
MSNQYLQWISSKRRGQVEQVELMQDGQTSEDVVVLPNGGKISMSKVGKEFIILPSTSSALSEFDLNMMYPVENFEKRPNKPVVKKEHREMMGIEPAANVQPQQKKPVKSSFSSDLLSRSKKKETTVRIDLVIEMPTAEFFEMINKTFDDNTINEVLDLIVDSVKTEEINKSIKNSITNFYQGKS